jgi:adenosine deaminase
MVTENVFGPASLALGALNPEQIKFLQGLPKAELHAHLNGSIPLSTLQILAKDYADSAPSRDSHDQHQLLIQSGLERLQHGVVLEEIHDFFDLFPAIYALTSTPAALNLVTKDVLAQFLDGEHPQCTYFELRTTPRITTALPTREAYLSAVLDVVESYRPDQTALIVSVDRRMSETDVRDCIDTAIRLNACGRRVVGVDLCGDPKVMNE